MVPWSVAVVATCFTDPLDPWSWAAEPALRRLAVEFGEEVEVTFVLVGLVRRSDDGRAGALALETLDAAAASGMPADARVWLRDGGPASSYPASLAVHAVAEQTAAGPYLRRLREAVYVEGRRMDTPDALLDAARDAGVANLERLRVGFDSSALLERLGADLDRARAQTLPGLPAVRFGADVWVSGWRWEDWRAAAGGGGAGAGGPGGGGPPGRAAPVRRGRAAPLRHHGDRRGGDGVRDPRAACRRGAVALGVGVAGHAATRAGRGALGPRRLDAFPRRRRRRRRRVVGRGLLAGRPVLDGVGAPQG